MSKRLNGPPGAPEALCPGTAITSIRPTVPFTSVPQTGQPGGLLLQPPDTESNPKRTTTARRGNDSEIIESPSRRITWHQTTSNQNPCPICRGIGFIQPRNRYRRTQQCSNARSESELNPFRKHKVIPGQNALHTRVHQLIDVQVRTDKNPIVEIPIEPCGDLIGMVAVGCDGSRRKWARRDGERITSGAGSFSLHPGIPELELPCAPSWAARLSRGTRTDQRVFDSRHGIVRRTLAGQEIGDQPIGALAYDAGKGIESDAAVDERADAGPFLQDLGVLTAHTPRPF